MAKAQKLGKVDPAFFNDVIYRQLGAPREEILHGPQVGLDNGVIQIGSDRVLVVTTDPISYIPEVGPEDSAWISAHLIISDLVTSGLMPQYAVMAFNLPPQFEDDALKRYLIALNGIFGEIGTAIITGHTGRYPGCDYSIIGSGTLMAIGEKSAYLSPEMAKPGDAIIITKGVMVGTAGLLARIFPSKLEMEFGSEFVARAQTLFEHYPTLNDAQIATRVGLHENGVTAMHDVAEGGVLGALYELGIASGCGMRVELTKIPICDEVKRIAELLELDPYSSLSEGTLLITTNPERADDVQSALGVAGIRSAHIGYLQPASDGMNLVETGTARPLSAPEEDRYWTVYDRARADGWT